ncbi:MAG: radical SAM protein [Proteobacteria bacterium]|nr:MAG: radical SAM protein [Pseudomonadota bacterium]
MTQIEDVVRTLGKQFRTYPLDNALLLFDRQTGTNVLLKGEETKGFKQAFPRVVQFSLSNVCNLHCSFCFRDQNATTQWTEDSAFDFLSEMAGKGLMEVAFGGGEPLLFKRFVPLVHRLYDQTPLCVNFTTNGTWLRKHANLASIAPKVGQVRLSIYDDNRWEQSVETLKDLGFNFGVNFLLKPIHLNNLMSIFEDWVARGVRDALILNYKGTDSSLILAGAELEKLERTINEAALRFPQLQLKMDVCFGSILVNIPRMMPRLDCEAGKDFLVVSCDKKIQPCSYHQHSAEFSTVDEVLDLWRNDQALKSKAQCLGCGRGKFL